MKNLKVSCKCVQSKKSLEKKLQKHDTNLQKNSVLYFQMGLIVCLLAAIGLLEMKFESQSFNILSSTIPSRDDRFEMDTHKFTVYKEPQAEVKQKQKSKKVTFVNKVDIRKDVDPVIETLTASSNILNSDIDPSTLTPIEKPNTPDEIDFILIENVPIYPGCEDKIGNNARKKCMSNAITKLVQRQFNGSKIALQHGLKGKQRISVQFVIDNTGKVSEIKTRASHTELEMEAKRVINKIPKMQPGKQRDKPVGVRYTIPIIFVAQ